MTNPLEKLKLLREILGDTHEDLQDLAALLEVMAEAKAAQDEIVPMVTCTRKVVDEFGPMRYEAICDSTKTAAQANMHFSYLLGISGAMRWPLSLRPEVVIVTEVGIR